MKKIVKEKWLILVAAFISIVIFNLERFISPFKTFIGFFNTGSVFQRYAESNIHIFHSALDFAWDKVLNIIYYFDSFNINSFLLDILRIISKVIIYGINYGLNTILIVYLLFYLFLSNEVEEATYTKKALRLNRIIKFLKLKIIQFKKFLHYFYGLQKKNILISILIIMFFSGSLITFILELLIFIYYYFKASFTLTTHIFLFNIFKSVVIFLLVTVPKWLIPILIFTLVYWLSFSSAMNKLRKNHDALKVIAKYEMSFINIITGPPGSGKTRSVVALSLASVENFIDELQDILFEIESKNPEINFGEIIKDKYQHINNHPKHYYYHNLLHKQKSMIASAPFSILDPYADDYSVILDFDYIRPNVFNDAVPLEEFKVIAISELDKEYNSHYNKSDVGEDGLHLFMGTVSHWLKRHGRIYIDYQQPTQVPLNVRGNAETFFSIKKSKEKMPLLLSAISFPFKLIYNFIKRSILSYSYYKRKINKKSLRNDRYIRKRYDYTLFFAILRHFNKSLIRILKWFDSFKYTVIYGSISNVEGEVRSNIKLKINSRDEIYKDSFLYDSTFLSTGYLNKQKSSKVNWSNAPSYKSIHPSDDELKMLHSKFIDKAFFDFDIKKEKQNKANKSDSKEISLDF